MSIEAINDFFNLLNDNEILSREFDATLKTSENFKQDLVKLAKRYRCEFTLEELEEVIEAAKHLKEKGIDGEQKDA